MKKIIFAALLLSGCLASANSFRYKVYPVPQSATAGTATVGLSATVNIVVEPCVESFTVDRAREVLEANGFEVTIGNALTDGTDLLIGANGSDGIADNRATLLGVDRGVFSDAPHRFDAHVVALTDEADMLVLGNGEGSEYYGLATVEQILEQRSADDELTPFTIADYSHTRYRGVVEGFYGHPFSVESRLDLFDYFKRYKLNYYLYAPKSDPYHTGRWREAYPDEITAEQRNLGQFTASDMRMMAEKAKRCGVQLVWACHPALQGNAISFSNLDAGVADIMAKFDMMYALGFRNFGVSVDDISGHPTSQWKLGDMVQTAIDRKYNTSEAEESDRVGHLIFVPSQYALNYGTYTLGAFADANPNLEIAFTGYDCFSNLRARSFDTMADLVGRDPIFWWNNPVNDDYDEFLYMHGLGVRWSIEQQEPVEHMRGLLLNPMNQGQASKICIFNAADYGWNPAAYDAGASWEAAVRSIAVTDDYTEAMKQFIECLSAYTTHDTKTPEGESYAPLYEACRQGIAAGVTAGYDELREAMDGTRRACAELAGLESSGLPSQGLLYEDIRPWVNKVFEQSDIIVRALDILSGNVGDESWTDVSTLLPRANAISTDERFRHSVLEGAGTSTYEKSMMVQPTPKYMDDFTRFIAAEASKCTITLPERSRTPEIITNCKPLADGVELTASDQQVELHIPDATALDPGEYIGMNINAIHTTGVTCESWLPDDAVVEISVNGKVWEVLPEDDDEPSELVYVRVRNDGDETFLLDNTIVTVNLPAVEDSRVERVLTNMEAYNTYVVENVADGDHETFFWNNMAQREGFHITLDFGKIGRRTECRLWFTNSDRPTGTVAIQSSADNENWHTHATFTADQIGSDGSFCCSLDDAMARYVRLYLQSVGQSYWFQLREFEVDGFATGWDAPATDSEGAKIYVLDDRDLSTAYSPRGAGWIEYRFTENIVPEHVDIYHISEFKGEAQLPTVSVMNADGEWAEMGFLNAARTIVDMTECPAPVAMRIEWNEVNVPTIHEIYPQGSLYVEPKKEVVGLDAVSQPQMRLILCYDDGKLTVESAQPIATVRVYDLAGQLVSVSAAAGSRIENAGVPTHGVAEITFVSGDRYTQKY